MIVYSLKMSGKFPQLSMSSVSCSGDFSAVADVDVLLYCDDVHATHVAQLVMAYRFTVHNGKLFNYLSMYEYQFSKLSI